MRLIEWLLVIAVIGIITVVILKSNLFFDHARTDALQKSDVAQITAALNRYFQTTGCAANGDFAGSLTPSLTELGLANLADGRAPNIDAYSARLHKFGVNKEHKALYEFEIHAAINKQLTPAQQQLLANSLNATLNGQQLIWRVPLSLANTNANDPLQGERIAQRQQLNTLTMGVQSYCAQ